MSDPWLILSLPHGTVRLDCTTKDDAANDLSKQTNALNWIWSPKTK